MRTIVAFLLAAFAALAQAQDQIERLEKNIAAHPGDASARAALLNALTNRNAPLPADQIRELRRQHILWLIEHKPGASLFEDPALLLPAKGRLADEAGSAEAAGLWKQLAERPGAKPEVAANAAIYLRAVNLVAARALLDGRPSDPAISRARGLVDGAAVLGISGLGQNVQFGSSAALRDSAIAQTALAEIEASTDANLLGGAGAALAPGRIEIPFDLTIGEADPAALAERWLRRAIELAPPGAEWKPVLGQTLQTKANRTLDPREKGRLLAEAFALVAPGAKPGILQSLAAAEFDAGDDTEAERDANLLLSTAPKNPNAYSAAQTILGRIAASKGDLAEAESRLRASVKMPEPIKNAVFQPEMTLAQDVYDAGGKDAVVQFLEASRAVWKFDRGRIDRMISFVKKAPAADLLQLSRQFPGSEAIRRPAPEFTATDRDGKTWTRDQAAGKVVALEFGSAPLAEKVARDRGVTMLRVQDDDVKRRFEVLTNPTVVVIDPEGNVSAFRSGPANEQEWRADFDSGFGKGPNPGALPAPKPIANHAEGGRATLAWEPVENAESYVVEWDSRGEQGWQFDRDKTVRVIPTRNTSAMLDFTGFTSLRWRVYAVPKSGPPGQVSAWLEIERSAFTKIYK